MAATRASGKSLARKMVLKQIDRIDREIPTRTTKELSLMHCTPDARVFAQLTRIVNPDFFATRRISEIPFTFLTPDPRFKSRSAT